MSHIRRLRRSVWFRRFERLFDAVGARPLGILVFALSLLGWVSLQESEAGFRADAVATGAWVDHPARAASFVVEVFVAPGEAVRVGDPLVRLSPYFIDQRLARLETRMDEVRNEAALAQAELRVVEQSWVALSARVRPNRPSLATPTSALYAKQIEVLETRKEALLEDRESLLVVSAIGGLAAQVVRVGEAVREGASVASVTPTFAEEVVAYVPSATPPRAIASGTSARLIGAPSPACRGTALVLRRGAAVEIAPEQLRGILPLPQHGLPVHISLPAGCELGVGQVVTVAFESAARG